MSRLEVERVVITFKNGKEDVYTEDTGDVIVVNEIITQPTGTPQNYPLTVQYLAATLAHPSTVAEGQKTGV